MLSDKETLGQGLMLPILHDCNLSIENFSCDSLNFKNDEITKENYYAKLSIKYNFSTNEASLSIYNSYFDVKVETLGIVYDFGKFVLSQDKIICVKDSKEYKFSTEDIPRHVFYTKYIGKIKYANPLQLNVSCVMEFSFDIPHFQKSTPFLLDKLGGYEIPAELEELNDDEKLIEYVNSQSLNREEKLSYAIYIEDLANQKEMMTYKLLHITLNAHGRDHVNNTDIYRFEVPEQSKKFLPANVLENSIQFIPMSREEKENKSKRRSTYMIDSMYEDETNSKTWIEFSAYSNSDFDTYTRYEVRFVPNNVSFQAAVKALKNIKEKKLENYFASFDVAPPQSNDKSNEIFEDSKFIWFNKNIKSNEEQKLAIKNIVNFKAFPFPYCIFGPPGTGKTSCLVECVLQILRLKPSSKILLVAQSNSACNEMGDRILRYTTIDKVFRLYTSRLHISNPSSISKALLPSSNLRNRKNEFPTVEQLKHFSIVISTPVSASQFDRGSLQNYFDYIFIDECAATTEPEACIPIVELGCDEEKVSSRIVLVGDPKQLPPVILSSVAEKLGLGMSLMERVMTKEQYLKNPDFNPTYIVQLCDNYRSHPSILHFSNVEFYDSKLRAKNNSSEVYSGTKWKTLPNRKFPVLFHHTNYPSEMDGKSSFNDGEIKIVQDYVTKLIKQGMGNRKVKESDIGIVTPYKAQSEKLKLVLSPEIEVGTSEYYQGREKLIMIISMVKSKSNIGFVADPRRFNVCITRAKALLIVIGNSNTLQKKSLLKRFMIYCDKNRSWRETIHKIDKKTKNNNEPPCEELKSLTM